MHSVKGGQDGGHAGGYYIDLVEFQGNTPPIFCQKGEFVRPLLRGGAVSPNNVPEKKEEKGGRARHGLRTPCQRVRIEFRAGWGTWERLPRAHFEYTPKWLKSGIYPHMAISLYFASPTMSRSNLDPRSRSQLEEENHQ